MKSRNTAASADSASGSVSQPGSTRPESGSVPTPQEIRERAFEIHIERGGIHGCDLDDWLQAERELQQRYRRNHS